MRFRINPSAIVGILACLGLGQVALAADPTVDSLGAHLKAGAELVTIDNYVRAETAAQFDRIIAMTGGVNKLRHFRQPTPIDKQSVIRMNRDTLYSFAVVDISKGATLVMPDSGKRYMSVMVVNEDEYINTVFHGGGTYRLTMDEFDTRYVLVAVRTLVDAGDPDDVKAVNALQDAMTIEAASAEPYRHPDYDKVSYEGVYKLLLDLSKYMPDSRRTFGRRDEVSEVRHMLGAAFGWGGLPETEAYYLNVVPGLPVGAYRITAKDVPVDAFWSISLYNKDGYFEANPRNAYNVNNISGEPNADGSLTVNLGGCGDGRVNCLPIMEGWNYIVRLYRPRREILDGSWSLPTAQPVE